MFVRMFEGVGYYIICSTRNDIPCRIQYIRDVNENLLDYIFFLFL